MTRWSAIVPPPGNVKKRWLRLLRHFIYPFYPNIEHLAPGGLSGWFVDLSLYIWDILFLPEIYKVLYLLIKPGIRALTAEEIAVARSVYLDTLDYQSVLIDLHSARVSKKWGVAYVTFGLIHCWKPLREDVFIHELFHVLQYKLYGSAYISHSIRAQWSNPSYDYGGLAGLQNAMRQGLSLWSFNFEQQASLIEHFYELRSRYGEDALAQNWSPYVHYWNEMLAAGKSLYPNK